MSRAFARTELLLGEEAMQRLQNARVAVFGVGGVGGYVVEALARSGVGALDLIDNDTVAETTSTARSSPCAPRSGSTKPTSPRRGLWTSTPIAK